MTGLIMIGAGGHAHVLAEALRAARSRSKASLPLCQSRLMAS